MKDKIKLLFVTPEMQHRSADLGLALGRLYFGLSMALAHGIKKVPPSTRWVEYVSDLGFPAADYFAWCAGITELCGGILIALGLFTRLSSLGLILTMTVAVFMGHAGDPFSKLELGLCYLFASLIFLSLGGGRYSLDYRIFSKRP